MRTPAERAAIDRAVRAHRANIGPRHVRLDIDIAIWVGEVISTVARHRAFHRPHAMRDRDDA